jgi:hypothetical protein
LTHVDGWKDEEADVTPDNSPEDRVNNPYDFVKSPETSARPCGCDPGANWVCVYYPNCAFGRAGG